MGAPPPDDALELDAQIEAGIGVPPPGPPAGALGGSLGLAGGSGGIGLSASASLVPPDAPELPSQIGAAAAASFEPTTPGILAMCGFKIPGFSFSISFSIKLPAFPPDFFLLFGLSLKCDLANPLEGEVEFGGGRVPSLVPELDAEFSAGFSGGGISLAA